MWFMPQTKNPHIVVMGVGNILLRDEGAGVRAMQLLKSRYELPEHVDLVDGGVLGLNLMAILERTDHLILFDCVRGGGSPGDIHHFDYSEIPPRVTYKDSLHQIDFVEVMSVLPLTAQPPQTVVIGVEPENMEPWGIELSPAVEASLGAMVEIALDELAKLGVEAILRKEPLPVEGV